MTNLSYQILWNFSWHYYTYFRWERLAHSRLPRRCDSRHVTPSLVGKNVFRAYGRSAQIACRMETVLAMLLSFLLWSLHCISLLHIRFHRQISILALEITEIAFIPMAPVHSCQSGKVWPGVTRTFVIGTNELNALIESMYTKLTSIVWHCTKLLCIIYNTVVLGET